MIHLAGYSFDPNKACIVCRHVISGAPVIAVAHDDDGDLQFVCGEEAHATEDWHLVCLEHLDLNKLGLGDMPTLEPGFAAERDFIDANWEVVSVD
ncbi:MAG: hypothetical protein EOP14_01785 [Pseudomonas sp.]|nr:MAG: hypothetical protein EOP14_01785 [Pseudomonas sp.]